MSDTYRRGSELNAYFVETTVDDYPAVFVDGTDGRPSGNCAIMVGVSDTLTYYTQVQTQLDADGSCSFAKQGRGGGAGHCQGGQLMVEMSGREIYDNFQNGVGPEGLANGAAIVKTIAGRYQERAKEIQQLAVELESAWEGDAADGAQRGAGPLLTEHETASHHFSVSEDLTDRQSGSYSQARNSVVPVSSPPADVPPWGPLSPGWVPYTQQVQEHIDASRHNVDVMNTYSGASTYNSANLPDRYGDLADDESGVAIDEPDTIEVESFHDTGDTGDEPAPGDQPRQHGTGEVSGPAPDGESVTVAEAAVGREGVLALRRPDGQVWLSGTGTRRLAERLVAQVPDVPPGHGAPVTVSLSALRETDRRGRHRAQGGVVRHRARPEVLRVKQLLALPTTGSGELYARDRRPPCYVDTVHGRYAVTVLDPDTVRVGLAHRHDLVAHLNGIR